MRNEFTYRSYQWLVDLDQLPRPGLVLGVLAGFSARDHLGDPGRSIRANLDHFLSGHGIDLHGGQVLMLAHARVLGYVFNPLTVYWCHDPDGTLRCVVAEVHNTYGQRHAYLLHTDDRGRAQTPKEFYVSPFYPVDGGYRMSLPEPGHAAAPVRGPRTSRRNLVRGQRAGAAPARRPARPAAGGRPPPLVHPGRVRPHPHPGHPALPARTADRPARPEHPGPSQHPAAQ